MVVLTIILINFTLSEKRLWACEMTQLVRVLATSHDDLSFLSKAYMIEKEDFHKMSSGLCTYTVAHVAQAQN